MANVVEIVVQGKDVSGPAIRSATGNLKSLGSTFHQVGNIASSFGNNALGSVVASMASAISVTERMNKLSALTSAAFLGIAAAAAAAGVAVGDFLGGLFFEKEAKRSKDLLSLYDIQNRAVLERLKLVNDLAGREAEINSTMRERLSQIRSLKQFTEFEKSTAALDVQKSAEEQIFQLRKKHIVDLMDMQQKANEKYAQALQSIADFEQRMRDKNFEKYIADLDRQIKVEEDAREMRERNSQVDFEIEQERRAASMQGFFQMVQARQELWNNSLLNMRDATMRFAATAAMSISEGIGNAVADIATGARSASEAFKEFGRSLLAMLVKTAVQLVINSVLAISLQGAISAAASAMGAIVASAWAAPAALVSLATFGANAAPANAALISTVGVAQGLALGGRFHSGMDFVPAEGSYVLSRGERVVQPEANEQLVDFLEGRNGNQTTQVNIYLDGVMLGRGLGQMSRDGRLEISAKAIV